MKKLILLIMIMLCISCSSRKVYATEKATIYNKNDFYISYDIENDVERFRNAFPVLRDRINNGME